MALPSLGKYDLTNYVIRKVSSVEEMRHTITKLQTIQGSMPAIDDSALFYNTDPDGMFIGQLNGETISCITVVKYGSSFAFLGTYIVLKEFRGNGYGLALFKHAIESVPLTYNIALDTVPGKNLLYQKWGFVESKFMSRWIEIDIKPALEKLDSFNSRTDATIQPASAVDFYILSAYDDEVFGAPHHLVLKGLLDGPNTITIAATNQSGELVGFVAARKMIAMERWRLAPLFADNVLIARGILQAIFREMIATDADRKFAMFEIFLTNPNASVLAEQLNARPIYDMVRMFTKGPLEFKTEKVFGFCAGELG